MKRSRLLAVLLCVAVVASAASGQRRSRRNSDTSVMKLIPASAAGYVVVPNVKEAAAAADAFLKQIDVNATPEGEGLLQMLKAVANLGEGFNADGGMAFVVLDPAQTGLDVIKLINEGDDAKEPDPKDLPIVFLVAGSGVKEVFGEAATADGDYFKIEKLPETDFPMSATHKNGFVILSPSKKAIKAVLSSRRAAGRYAGPDHVKLIGRSNIAMYVNMKVVAPILTELMKAQEKKMTAMIERGVMPFDMTKMFAMLRDIIGQVDAMTVSVNVTSSNVIIDQMLTLTRRSELAEAVLTRPSATPQLNRLPNLPYVLALSAVEPKNKASLRVARKIMTNMLSALDGPMPKDVTEKKSKIQGKLISQITKIQMVAGGAPSGSGLFGTTYVLTCKDSAVVKGLLAESASLVKNIPNLKEVGVAYQKGIETAGELSVDAIAINVPEMANMPEDMVERVKKIFGEDKPRVLVVAPDKNTVIMTFGGSLPFLEEAIKANGADKNLLTRDQLGGMKKYLPAKLSVIGLINLSNLLEVAIAGANTMMPGITVAVPFSITTKDPIMVAGGVTGKVAHIVVAIPAPLIKEVSQGVLKVMMMMRMMGGRQMDLPGDDF